MEFLEVVLNTLMLSLVELFLLLGLLICVGFLLGVLEKYSNKFLYKALGPRGVLATAWIGTPVHELGHLLQCFIWGHRVTKVKFLQLNNPNGVLGYVEHQYNPSSIYQQIGNFFIGMGPVFSGIGALLLGMYVFIPESFYSFSAYIGNQVSPGNIDVMVIVSATLAITKSLCTLENLLNPFFWIYLVFAVSISSHISLSKADINGASRGLQMIFLVLFITNLIAVFFKVDTYRLIVILTQYNVYVLAFSSIALLFSLITLVISLILYKLKSCW